MKILLITQKMDESDGVLGFFTRWTQAFSKQFEKVSVMVLQKGIFNLPQNVAVMSLGKEDRLSRMTYLWRFYKYIIVERKNYDAVFVHMNPIYVVLGGPIWFFLNKKISLWYAHGKVPMLLRLGSFFTDIIFTSTKSGCRIQSKKIKVIGQGIDTDFFLPQEKDLPPPFKLVTVGRISPVKKLEVLIDAVENLNNVEVSIVGAPGLIKQVGYFDSLLQRVRGKNLSGKIKFVGELPNKDIAGVLGQSHLFVNMSVTGSLDKAVGEAMSAGLPILTCNVAFKEVLGQYVDSLMYQANSSLELKSKIELFMLKTADERKKIGLDLRGIVIKDHSLDKFIGKIKNAIEEA